MAVQFQSATSVICRLYDSDGTSLLNSLSVGDGAGLPGGVAMRALSGFSLDTITSENSAGVGVHISPTNSGSFSNGYWTGNVAVQEVVNDVSLRADDGTGHQGQSNPFDVLVMDDVSVTVVGSPDPAAVGANLTYTVNVVNSGPSPATGVSLTNVPPASAGLVSFSVSQGSCSNVSGVIRCQLGDLAGGAAATCTIVVRPTTVGSITNIAVVSRNEADAYLANNTAMAAPPNNPPFPSINDGS